MAQRVQKCIPCLGAVSWAMGILFLKLVGTGNTPNVTIGGWDWN